MATPINTVPLGESGTGNAFVLGNSQAANQLLNTIQANRKVAQQQEEYNQQLAKQTAANWQKNQLKVDGGLYWQPEFNKRYQGHLEKGIQLRQMGIDPYNYNPNDPNQAAIAEDYLLERQAILSDVDTRKALEANVGKQMGLIKGNPANYYASDIAALNKYIETPFSEASKMTPPTLTERFKPNTVLQKIVPAQVGSDIVVGDKRIKSVKALVPETRAAIVSGYANDPASQRWVDELTGGQGFTIPMLEKIPSSKETIEKDLKTQYDGNPDLRTQLAAQGIIGSDSKAFKDYAAAEANRLSTAKNIWDNQIQSDLTQILPKVKQMESTLPDYGARNQARADERLNLARAAAARAAEGGSGNKGELDRQVLVEELASGVPNSGEKVNAIMMGRGYDGPLKIEKTKAGDKITFVIPSKTDESISTTSEVDAQGKPIAGSQKIKTNTKVIPGKRVTIDVNEAGYRHKLNEVLNEVTGESIKVSKYTTGEPSGKIKGGRVSSAPANQQPKTTTKTTTFIGLPQGGKF